MKTCFKHPKYNGRKKPTNQCPTCASLYFLLKIDRILPMPTKIVKSKKIYNRKKKIDTE